MTNEITLDGTQYLKLEKRSTYNNNYFQHKVTCEIILVQYEECSNAYEYFSYVEGQPLTFLGASIDYITDGIHDGAHDGIIKIHTDWF
jgi:hypothetical protein